jgi:hypothetical protein
MRENRTYGSEGGEAKSLPYPYHWKVRFKLQHTFAVSPRTAPELCFETFAL